MWPICLTGLVTTSAPVDVLAEGRRRQHSTAGLHRLAVGHLPQGAPTSPALANFSAFGLDVRMAGLADRFAAAYTRSADDLLVSGEPCSVGSNGRWSESRVDYRVAMTPARAAGA